MKEFSAQTGGRFTYADDLVNLQNLALALTNIFSECDNFVLSGCEVKGSSVSAGYVYINGKIRQFSGATGISKWPQYIYESNTTENVSYASGSDKVGRNVYGCAIGEKVPTTNDKLTGKVPSSLMVRSTGATTFKEAFIGRYALLLNASGNQSAAGSFTFDQVGVKNITVQGAETLSSGGTTVRKSINGNNLVIHTQSNSGSSYDVTIENGVGYHLEIDGKKLVTFGKDGATFYGNISNVTDKAGGSSSLGSMAIVNDDFYNTTSAADSGAIKINMLSQGGGTGYYRNTIIGNGKNSAILSVIGRDAAVKVNGALRIEGDTGESIVLKSGLAKSNASLLRAIIWKDSSSEVISKFGFTNTTDTSAYWHNFIGDVGIYGKTCVVLGPAIMEGDKLLREKYVLSENLSSLVANKAEASSVYTKTAADGKFAVMTGGFAQFIKGSVTQASLRKEIDAASTSDVKACVQTSQLLSDMATDENKKRQIRANIGAAGVDEFQPKLKDTGWQVLSGTPGLYARQIGNVVAIQGRLRTIHEGTVFTLPNTIDPPVHAVFFNNSNHWEVVIAENSRAANVAHCNGACQKDIVFSLTYMV